MLFSFHYSFAILWYTGLATMITLGILYPPTMYLNMNIFLEESPSSSSFFLSVEKEDKKRMMISIFSVCGIYVGMELLQCLSSLRMRTPSLPSSLPALPSTVSNTSSSYRHHLMIACHNTDLCQLKSIVQNWKEATQRVIHLWIAENGILIHEDEEKKKYCESEGVHYRYYSIASKTHALYETARCIAEQYRVSDLSSLYLILMDDDTKLPVPFHLRDSLFTEDDWVAGYTCCIGIDKNPHHFHWWEHLIDFEYRTLSWRNGIKSHFTGTISFLHGIFCVYRMDAFLDIYRRNPCRPPGQLPFGEDSYAGLDARLHGWKLKQDNTQCVYTYCPPRVFPPWFVSSSFSLLPSSRVQGYGASSLWKQRACRWYLSWLRRFPAEWGLIWFYDTGTWSGNINYRLDFLKYCFITFSATFWFLYLLKLSLHHSNFMVYLYLHLGLAVTAQITGYLRYWCMSSVIKEDVLWYIPLFYPLLLVINSFFMGCAFFKSILWYIPFFRRRHGPHGPHRHEPPPPPPPNIEG